MSTSIYVNSVKKIEEQQSQFERKFQHEIENLKLGLANLKNSQDEAFAKFQAQQQLKFENKFKVAKLAINNDLKFQIDKLISSNGIVEKKLSILSKNIEKI